MLTHNDPTLTGLTSWVVAHPFDHGPRYQYADRLEELGRYGEAEFLRGQLDNPSDRLRNIRIVPGLGPVPVVIRRGFPECVSLPAGRFLAHAATLFATLPLTRVVLTDLGPGPGNRWVRATAFNRDLGWAVPAALFDRMEAPEEREDDERCRYYVRPANAVTDLSNAAVRHGRDAAGLESIDLDVIRARMEYSSAR